MSNSAPATLNLLSVIKDINSVAWQQHASLERKDARMQIDTRVLAGASTERQKTQQVFGAVTNPAKSAEALV